MAKNNQQEPSTSRRDNDDVIFLNKQTLKFEITKITEKICRVQLQCYKKDGVPITRQWMIKGTLNKKWLTIEGMDKSEDKINYAKSFCKVDVFVSKWRKAMSCQVPLNEVNDRGFVCPHLCNMDLIRKSCNSLYPNPIMDLYVKIELGIDYQTIDGAIPLKFDSLVNSNFLSDCYIKTEVKNFPCHKVLLASKSDYFKAMFTCEMKESKENVINWTTVFDAETVNDLLHFIYTGNTPPNIDNTCQNLIHAAYLCNMKDLQEICADRLATLVHKENVLDILQIAEKYDIKELKDVAANYVAVHKKEMFQSAAWQDANTDMLRDLFRAAMDVLVPK